MVTVGRVGSVALLDDNTLLGERVFEPARGHGGRLLPEIDRLLTDTGIGVREVDLFAACAGPGSFTGVRVGLATASSLAWATGKPATGINTLDVLAQNECGQAGYISPVLDARRSEVYAALHRMDESGLSCVIGPKVMPAEQWIQRAATETEGGSVRYLGSGVAAYPEWFGTAPADHRVRAAALAEIAASHEPDHRSPAQPLYVRPSHAEIKFGAAPAHDPMTGVD
jgi:tRNA threonylcarbamoyladenosine biosynthesis protein TsaB